MVEWAVNAIELGYDSESLIILAGLDYDSTEEREKYFWQSIEELKLDVKKEEHELIIDYAKYVSNAVLDKLISPISGLKKMNVICRSTEYDSKYIQFYELEEDLEYLNYGEHPPIYNPKITIKDADEFIVREFELFLECDRIGVTRELLEKSIYNNCGEITKAKFKTKFQLKKPFKYQEFVCNNCGSNQIDSIKSQIGKEKLLKKIKPTPNNA